MDFFKIICEEMPVHQANIPYLVIFFSFVSRSLDNYLKEKKIREI